MRNVWIGWMAWAMLAPTSQAGLPLKKPQGKPKIAAIITEWRQFAHADVLDAARKRIATAVRCHHLVARTADRQDVPAVMGRIRCCTDYGLLGDADFVIENVTEDWNVKQNVYGELERSCHAQCVFAANTSAIMIMNIYRQAIPQFATTVICILGTAVKIIQVMLIPMFQDS